MHAVGLRGLIAYSTPAGDTARGHCAPDPGGTGVEGIVVARVDGSHEREIQPRQGGLFPAWSPDGRRIALSTLRADGSETIVTHGAGRQPADERETTRRTRWTSSR